MVIARPQNLTSILPWTSRPSKWFRFGWRGCRSKLLPILAGENWYLIPLTSGLRWNVPFRVGFAGNGLSNGIKLLERTIGILYLYLHRLSQHEHTTLLLCPCPVCNWSDPFLTLFFPVWTYRCCKKRKKGQAASWTPADASRKSLSSQSQFFWLIGNLEFDIGANCHWRT